MGVDLHGACSADAMPPPDDHTAMECRVSCTLERAGSNAAPDVVASGCGIADWRELAGVVRACFPALPDDEVAYYLTCGKPGIRILRVDGRIAAFSINNPTHSPDFAWLEMIGVAPDFRRRGLGKRALDDYERFVASCGYRRIEFAVDADNDDAIALYEDSGYQRLPRPGRRLTFCKPLPTAAGVRVSIDWPSRPIRIGRRLLYRALVGV